MSVSCQQATCTAASRPLKKPPGGGSQFKRDDRGSSECYLIQLPPILLCLSHHQSQYLTLLFLWQFAMNSSSVHSFVLEGFCGCAAETFAVVPISVSTAMAAEIRSIGNPPIIRGKCP